MPTKSDPHSQATTPPLFRCNSNLVQGAVFGDGKLLSVSITKRYKDRESDEYKNSKTYFPGDLPNLVRVAKLCLHFCEQHEA